MSARWRQVAGVAAFMAVAAQFAAQAAASQTDATEVSATSFAHPPLRYRPAAAVKIGLTPESGIPSQLQTVVDRGFGAMLISPGASPTPGPPTASRDPTIQRVIRAVKNLKPSNTEPDPLPDIGEHDAGSAPPYLSEEYFRRYEAALAFARAHGLTTVLYDELGYPTGGAGGGKIDPKNFRKLLVRTKLTAQPGSTIFAVPKGILMAAVAMNEVTKVRLDLTPRIANGALRWSAPGPHWTVQFFNVVTSEAQGGPEDYYAVVDYFDPQAVQQFIDITYEAYARHVGQYFGNTIAMTFFDDVGIYSADRTWAAGIGDRFAARYQRSPAIYYPALWEDIGTDTAAARVAFFATRADMLADGFPRLVTEWTARHGLEASGHTPGQYEIQPTDMNGDPFKFYRAQPIPMIDVIFVYGFGRDGFKLTTSAADSMDKPIVAAEQFTTCGTPTGYKRAMDSFARGVNYLITCSRSDVGGPTAFAEWAGRISMLLQGGRHVADVAIVYPIASLQAYYRFDASENQEGPVGRFAPASADYLTLGERLTGDLHRDFTFIHPDDLASNHLKISGGRMILDNPRNRQEYSVIILPGGEVISVAAMRKLKAFFDAGGALLATTQLPSRSAEFGRDAEVRTLVAAIFGRGGQPGTIRRNRKGGSALFIEHAEAPVLRDSLARLAPPADISFAGDPSPHSGNGELAYIHKVKDGRQVIFVANSSDEPVNTEMSIRGAFALELWDPFTGKTMPAKDSSVASTGSGERTTAPLSIGPGSSVFVIGEPAPVMRTQP